MRQFAGFQTLDVGEEGGILTVRFNRPDSLNAMDARMLQELGRALDLAEEEPSVQGVILTGAGRAFIAGAEIGRFVSMDAAQAQEFAAYGQEKICGRIEDFPKPVVAAVNGYALGGGNEIAMSCDLRIASAEALFSQPEASLGILPIWGGIRRLVRLVGVGAAKDLILTGRKVGAEEAVRMGLVNRVVPPEELMPAAEEALRAMLKNAPLALRLGKAAVNCAADMDLTQAHVMERDMARALFSSEDKREGTTAFLEKRRAKFQGR